MEWSPQQEAAIVKVNQWVNDPHSPQVFRLFGYAGTGKSTMAQFLAQGVRGSVLYAAFTGKAALVMRKRGCLGATTIHSLIYIPYEDPKTGERRYVINSNSAVADAKLVIIDEVSMVNQDLALDLLSFGTKVLVLGDPGQLPPVEGTGYFISVEPDVMLTEIHRQARENKIIRLSGSVRTNGMNFINTIPEGNYDEVSVRASRSLTEMMAHDQVLCGTNKTRTAVNAAIRAELRYPSDRPVAGDKVICLKNNREKALLNGQIWFIDEVISFNEQTGRLKLIIRSEDDPKVKMTVSTHIWFFRGTEDEFMKTREGRRERGQYDEFTFGYAITVHKSQGSQWDKVYLIDESFVWSRSSEADVIKHLYTGITRAAETITIVRGR